MFSQSFNENKRSSSYSDLSHGLPSQNSQEMFSQGCTAPLDQSTLHHQNDSEQNPYTSDYWSQSSSQQDDALLNYSKRPLLFASKIKKPLAASTSFCGGGSYKVFQEFQQQKITANNQKDMLQTFVKLLEESSSELKSTLESLHVNITTEVKSSVNSVKSSLESNELILNKLQCEVVESLKNMSKEFICQSINETEFKLKHKDEKIQELEDKIAEMRKEIANFNEKESLFHREQVSMLNSLLGQNKTTCAAVETIKSSELDLKIVQLVEQNNMLNTLVHHLISFQETVMSSLEFLKERVSYPPCQCGCNNLQQNVQFNSHHSHFQSSGSIALNNHHSSSFSIHSNKPNNNEIGNTNCIGACIEKYSYGSKLEYPPHKHCHLPSVLLQPYTFDKCVKSSPVAVVAPTCQVKQETVPDNYQPMNGDVLVTLVTDSNALQKKSSTASHNVKGCEVMKGIKQSQRYDKQLSFSNLSLTTSTPDLVRKDETRKTTPIQRSIRRYGKIKKSIDLFSPAPIMQKKPQQESLGASSNERNKKKPGESWNELLVLEKSPAVNLNRTMSTRGSLAMKRKQENAFNFEIDHNDMKRLVLLLQGNGKSNRSSS